MKTTMNIILTLLALGASALVVNAQDSGNPPTGGGPGGGGPRHRPPPLPLIVTLDANHDRVIDASEIANAPAALKALDKNGDGQLTPDEFIGRRPHMGPPPENGAGPDNAGPPPNDNGGANGPARDEQ